MDVRVEQDGDSTAVTLMGLNEPAFTAFSQQNPERVVVDLAVVRPDTLSGPIAVYDGLVDEITLSPISSGTGEEMTRVEVSLEVPADFHIVSSENGLVIRLHAKVAETSDADPWAMVPTDDAANVDSSDASDGAGDWSVETTPATPATTLTGVQAWQAGEGTVVHLQADGIITSAESFTLENPDRLVIDLAGLKRAVDSDRIEVDSSQVAQIRIGQHAEWVRVVIDGGSGSDSFQGRRVTPSNNGLVVALGRGDALDAAVAEILGGTVVAAEEPEEQPADPVADDWTAESVAEVTDAESVAEVADEELVVEVADAEPVADVADEDLVAELANEPVTIYGVEYDPQDMLDRIVILGDGPVDYLLYEPEADTVILSIQNAVIDPEVAVRITPDSGGPVSLITAFEQPDSDFPEVRIVVKRADGLKPRVSRRGSMIVVDFPHDGVAGAIPVLAGFETTVAVTEAGVEPVPASIVQSEILPEGVGIPGSPAALEAPAAIDILQEGGLVPGKQYVGRRISLDFKDIDMTDVLRLVAEVSDLNVIAGDEVAGKVTIRLVDVPWDQALDVILLTKGLGFVRIGNVLRIAPKTVLRQEEEMRLQEKRHLEQLQDLVVKLQPVNYADVRRMRGMIQRLLTDRGTVDADERTNTLIIKDIPTVIDEAVALVKAIDTMTPQVLIEAKIVEAALDFSREFGSVWNFGVQPLNNAFDSGSGDRSDLGSDFFRLYPGSSGAGNTAFFSNPLTAGPTALFNIAGFLLDEKLNLELQLQAAEVNGDGKVISSPRIVTLDNQKATIEQGVSIPFQTFENGDAQLEFVDAVLKLDVRPHITADRSIIMDIAVSRNAPDDSVFTLTGSPAISKNQVKTKTLVKDGQTLVIGGIYVVDKGQRQSRVPYLHRIPLIGAAFRSDEISDSRKELLIFVTPRIVITDEQASAS
ncbi:MAG: type IV pilus secretin PilQ [Myxococcales bacterium]|nr:type IV pilus secretin PilQ [Myxococcales bacterium]